MVWQTVRWNIANVSAVAAFCVLPLIAFAAGNPGAPSASRTSLILELHEVNNTSPCSISG